MEKNEKTWKWKELFGKFICIALILLGIYVFLEYVLGLFLPFLIAALISIPVRYFAKVSAEKIGGKKKCWAAFYIATFWSLVLLFSFFALKAVILQAESFFSFLIDNKAGFAQGISSIIENLTNFFEQMPFFNEVMGEFGEEVGQTVNDIVKATAEKGASFVTSLLGGFIAGTPKAVISAVVCIMASVYMSLDADKIKTYFLSVLGKNGVGKIKVATERVMSGVTGYFKAYSILFLINFTLIFLGLTILGRNFAFVIALIVGFFDILPLFSAAVVLVPWGVVLISWGDYKIGIGLILLAAITAIVRQIAEPRLVGKNLGLHPLASLFAMYVGVRILGFWGIILAPVSALMIKEIIENDKNKDGVNEVSDNKKCGKNL